MTNKQKTSSVLHEHGVKQLTEYQHARTRTELYLGSRALHEQPVLLFNEEGFNVQNLGWVPSLLTCIREVCDNTLDEFVKAGTKEPVLKVKYNQDELEFEVSDNGRGIPIDYVPETQKHVCTMVLTEMKTGRNFNDDERTNVIGMNGLGGSVVMMVSEKAEIEIHRTGKPHKSEKANSEYDGMYKFTQKLSEGSEMFPELQISEPTIRKVKTDKTGTTISFKLSKEVFKVHTLPVELVYSILKEIAAANPTYKIFFNESRVQVNKKGLFGNSKNVMQLQIKENNFDSTFYIVPDSVTGLDKNFHMQGLVNNAPSLEGGTHLDAFQQKFALGVIKALDKESKRRSLTPNRSDVEEGLLIYNVTKMNAPTFNSQIKTKLTNESAIKPVLNALNEDFFTELVKKNKEWINSIYTRCAERTNKKDADEDRKVAKRLLKGKVAKLRDANGTDRSKCILLIAEGDCLYEETEVLKIEDSVFKSTKIKNINPGDYVLTHNNNIKKVQAVTHKVKDTITFNTKYGKIITSESHKMLILRDNEYKFEEAKNIKSTDKFVRSQLVDVTYVENIQSITTIDEDKYKYLITLECGSTIKSSPEHTFMVYTDDNEFREFKCMDLKAGQHSVLLK